MANVRAHVTIRGVVQGVGFRNWTVFRATSLGLYGWVKNLPDGNVEAVFEGTEASVTEMIQASHTGPSMARVESIDIRYEDYSGEFSSFAVLR